MNEHDENRPLTKEEYELIRWMLVHGSINKEGCEQYLEQLETAEVTPWRCECGCASIDLQMRNYPPAPPGVDILGDFVFGEDDEVVGIFIYASEGILSGLEVYGLGGDAPRRLPKQESLRKF